MQIMHQPALAGLCNLCLSQLSTMQMLVKSTRCYPYFGFSYIYLKIIFTSEKLTEMHWQHYSIALILNKVKIQCIENFKNLKPIHICLPACHKIHWCWAYASSFSHNKGDQCLNTNLLYQRMFILITLACTLIVHCINLRIFLLKIRVSKFYISQIFHKRC